MGAFFTEQRCGFHDVVAEVEGLSSGLWPHHCHAAHSSAADHRLEAQVEGVLPLYGAEMGTVLQLQ